MHSTPYQHWLGTVALATSLCASVSAHAADATLVCTGTLSVTGGHTPSIYCSDALTISNGSLSFEGALNLSAGTALSLIDATLTAPSFSIVAGTDFTLDANSALKSDGSAGAISISAPSTALQGSINTASVRLIDTTPVKLIQWTVLPGGFSSITAGRDAQIPTIPAYQPNPWPSSSYPSVSGAVTISVHSGTFSNALAVPEPSTWLLLVLGLVGMTSRRVWSAN